MSLRASSIDCRLAVIGRMSEMVQMTSSGHETLARCLIGGTAAEVV